MQLEVIQMLISLVGKSGSGKTTIAKTLASYDKNIFHIDVDKISHQVLTYPKIKERIKTEISATCVDNDLIKRKKLGQIVFKNPQMMEKLTNITWPSMEKIIDTIIENNSQKIILLDWVLLPKTKYFNQSTLKIWVEAPQEERFMRIINRSGQQDTITKAYFLQRDTASTNYNEEKYDIVINNSQNTSLTEEVKKLYEKCVISR